MIRQIFVPHFLLSFFSYYYFGLISVPTQMTDVSSILCKERVKSLNMHNLSGLRGTPFLVVPDLLAACLHCVVGGFSRLPQEVLSAEEMD